MGRVVKLLFCGILIAAVVIDIYFLWWIGFFNAI